jgi:prepilin-type N-terminal cleavage/methylation domain-containing protein
MKRPNEKGVTLIELLLTVTIMGTIAAAGSAILSACLTAQGNSNARSTLYQEGLIAMERMTSGVRRCTYLLIPNQHNQVRDILAFSGTYNDDNDYYFDDPLFPRIDEDPEEDMSGEKDPGIPTVDDDGDGSADEGSWKDDDEDGISNEDPLDGIDNDGDGLIDEDFTDDATNDGEPGILAMDDDGDGSVDEGNDDDDDEDGSTDEDPLNALVYLFDSGSNRLRESFPETAETTDLSTHVTLFRATYEAPERILIELTLTGDDGETVEFVEYVCPRNTFQKTGRRVR